MARALVAEASLPLANALVRFLTVAGHDVARAQTVEDAVGQLADAGEAPLVVLASTVGFPGEALCAKVKATAPWCPVLLSFAADESRPAQRAQVVGADAWFLLPPRGHQVQALVALCEQLIEARTRAASAQRELLQVQAQALSGQKREDADFFKKYMVLEVKRSRRYALPVALLLAGLDTHLPGPALKAEIVAGLSGLLRDIDIVVAMADDRFLVFLPHTPREGAVQVAGRVQAKLSTLPGLPGLRASVGVATFHPRAQDQKAVTFGALLSEATALLAKAIEKGGGQVLCGGAPVPKRSRISLG